MWKHRGQFGLPATRRWHFNNHQKELLGRGKKCTWPSLSFTCTMQRVQSCYQEKHKTTTLSNSVANIMVWLLVWWLTTELNLTGINWGLTHERSAPIRTIVIPESLPHTVVSFFRFWGGKRNASWAETASELFQTTQCRKTEPTLVGNQNQTLICGGKVAILD